MNNRKMIRAIPLRKLQKNGLCFEAMQFFLPFSIYSADFKILCSGSHSNHVKFFSFMFMRKISI